MKILFLEDDLTIADFVKNGLIQAGYVIDHVTTGIEAIELALKHGYDVGIFDIMVPTMNGLEVIDCIRERHIEFPIIILSAKRSIDEKLSGFHHGADDYLIKPFSFSELLARIQALIKRTHRDIQSTSLSVGELTIDLLSRAVYRAGIKIDLQPKEFSLLEYLMRNKGQVVSKTMIMERVWDYNFDPQTNVVEARLSKLREKVDKGFSTQYIYTVRGLGYVLKDSNE